MTQKKKRLKVGINITVSPQAHKKMQDIGYKASPRLSLREHVNIINKLPKEL